MCLLLVIVGGCAPGSGLFNLVVPEQRLLDLRDPAQLVRTPIPPIPPPQTVTSPAPTAVPTEMSLDDALRVGLENSQVVRILTGFTAISSGQTIYDTAIANTAIDVARATFDPVFTARNSFNRSELPQAVFAPGDPKGAAIDGVRIDNYELGLGVSKRNVLGGVATLDFVDDVDRQFPGPAPLNPRERSALTLSYEQPLLQGAGLEYNLAPIIIARINTERSYFQFKDGMQNMVRGVIEGYWNLVFARTDAWARRQQVEQGEAAYARAEARRRRGFGTAAEEAQAAVALANFRANLIAAEANLLDREAALRNILGLSPSQPERITPTTPPSPMRFEPNWDEVVRLAEQQRPDLIELKLIIEADQQVLLQAQNEALPQLNTSMLYRWNGLEGETPTGARLETRPGQFTDWTIGVNFSVPLGLRQGRANLRRAELVLMRDHANLEQGLHATLHLLAANVRNLAQYYKQYEAYKEMRAAARINLEQQLAEFRAGRGIFINVLQAITDWGNAVSFEARALSLYNIELANLEQTTGTILESHGIRFHEELYGSIGPLGHFCKPEFYPSALVPGPNAPKYPVSAESAEKALEAEKPSLPTGDVRPPERPPLPGGDAGRVDQPRPD
jgi:outer membrane protein TolC